MDNLNTSKHIFCITAYKDFAQLSHCLAMLSPDSLCLVHVDKRSAIPASFSERWRENPNVRVIQTQEIKWGSYRHVLAVLDLLALIPGSDYDYVHIISENTLPISTKKEFAAFFARHKDRNYLEMTPLAQQDPEYLRTRYYYFQHIYDSKKRFVCTLEKAFVQFQKLLHINRRPPLTHKGYLYCHLTSDFVNWITAHPGSCQELLRITKYCYVPEEYFFQNLILRSPFAETAVSDALIYDVWDDPSRGWPAVLNSGDWDNMRSSGKLFARKFSSQETNLLSMLPQW